MTSTLELNISIVLVIVSFIFYVFVSVYFAFGIKSKKLQSFYSSKLEEVGQTTQVIFSGGKENLTPQSSHSNVRRKSSFIESPQWIPRKSSEIFGDIFGNVSGDIRRSSVGTIFTVGRTLALPGFMQLELDHDFKCTSLLNEGGHGLLFLGELDKPLTIQQNQGKKTCVVKNFFVEGNQDLLNGFNQEIAITFFFQHNESFVQLLGYCVEPKMMILKYYNLGSLKKAIESKEAFSDTDWKNNFILEFIFDIASAVAEMHHSGICHNDLKPANILLERQPKNNRISCVLCDFGVASVFDDNLMRVKAMVRSQLTGASIAYAAPEVLMMFSNDSAVTYPFPSADIYSLAVTMFEVLCRRSAWTVGSREIQKLVSEGKRPTLTKTELTDIHLNSKHNEILTLISKCWVQDPMLRLPIKRVITKLYVLKK